MTIFLSILAGLLVAGLPVAAVILLCALAISGQSPLPVVRALGNLTWSTSTSFLLVSVPLYVMLGQILLESGVAGRMYEAIRKWLHWLPGGVMHANIGASALFAATSGSSTATAATIGIVALPQMEKHQYHEKTFLGTLAAGGTLGILIPPSLALILYGALTNTSIPKLYAAALVPAALLVALFMVLTVLSSLIFRSKEDNGGAHSLGELIRCVPDLLPPILIFAIIVGTIYSGVATATESAAFGVLAAFLIALARGRVSARMLGRVFEGTMVTTSMIMLIVIASFFLNWTMNAVGLAREINGLIEQLDVNPVTLMGFIVLFYLVLGLFMESISITVMTLPIIAPIVVSAGFDPIWFGVVFVILLECALITPPVGMNLFVVQGLRSKGTVLDVAIGALPFVLVMIALIGVLILFPQIALYLPSLA
ncbi:membrane protein [Tistrella bauzanensis]|uniref:TRAP transporter large permease protein n=1 Tax=Tistrella bauzanensis TaxID=657419 RepID=A0ABQ1J0J7_9PROT|nr:TRAP transporter large permease [Tistrella bauzanensis]GGB54295.1 membrane protein [Tistrella bauzanensis]